jgi:hypothetical protein
MRQEENMETERGAVGRGNGNGSSTPGTATGMPSTLGPDGPGMGDAVRQRITQAKDRLADTVIAAQDRSTEMVASASGTIQRWPFSAVAIAAGIGVAVGWLLATRSQTSLQSMWPRRSLW